jgi:putative GTP pyrophosphokinase
MDFWASLEHKIYYKFEGNAPEYISRDLRECSGIVAMLDAKMLSLNEAVMEAKEIQDSEKSGAADKPSVSSKSGSIPHVENAAAS